MNSASSRSGNVRRGSSRARGMSMEPEPLFKALADTTRLRMLMLLLSEGELCVCELTHALDEIQPKISRHLAQLRESGLVLDRRNGQWIYYRINPDLPAWVDEVLAAAAQGSANSPPFDRDRRTLADMPGRPDKGCCG
jgi:ArsR family transcriptional regulator